MKIKRFGNLEETKTGLRLNGFSFLANYEGEPFTYAGGFKAVIDHILRCFKEDPTVFEPIKPDGVNPILMRMGSPIETAYYTTPIPKDEGLRLPHFIEVDERLYQLVVLQVGNVLTTEIGLIPGTIELIDVDHPGRHPDNVIGYCLTLEDPPKYFLRVKETKDVRNPA